MKKAVMLIWRPLAEASLPLRCDGINYLRGRDASTSGRQMSMTPDFLDFLNSATS